MWELSFQDICQKDRKGIYCLPRCSCVNSWWLFYQCPLYAPIMTSFPWMTYTLAYITLWGDVVRCLFALLRTPHVICGFRGFPLFFYTRNSSLRAKMRETGRTCKQQHHILLMPGCNFRKLRIQGWGNLDWAKPPPSQSRILVSLKGQNHVVLMTSQDNGNRGHLCHP